LPGRGRRPNIAAASLLRQKHFEESVAREYEPVKGQWYENIDENDSFRVLSVDEDSELIEIEYLDGDIEELDLDTWQELDLEKIDEPEGWSAAEEEEEEEEKKEKDELEETWDEEDDEDDDEDLDEDEEENESY
jgi:hypothetical protein